MGGLSVAVSGASSPQSLLKAQSSKFVQSMPQSPKDSKIPNRAYTNKIYKMPKLEDASPPPIEDPIQESTSEKYSHLRYRLDLLALNLEAERNRESEAQLQQEKDLELQQFDRLKKQFNTCKANLFKKEHPVRVKKEIQQFYFEERNAAEVELLESKELTAERKQELIRILDMDFEDWMDELKKGLIDSIY